MPVRALWNYRKLFTFPYTVGAYPVELTKYSQTDFFNRIMVRLTGNVVVAGAGPGAATGVDNPEGLLLSANLQTSPTVASVVPFNNVSGRGLRWDSALNWGNIVNPTTIPDTAGTQPVDFQYEFIFKRNGIRKAVEYCFDISKYTSALLTLNFGGRTTLFSGGTNTWTFNVNVEIWADTSFANDAEQEHAVELFEQVFTITAAQKDYPINQLPPGFLYTDFMFLTEVNSALANTLLNNIDIEGGGRNWTIPGDGNAAALQRAITLREMDGSVSLANLAGVYAISMRDGMFSRQIDALLAPIVIKLDVNAPGGTMQIRLVGRRMVPGAVKPKAAKPQTQGKKSFLGNTR